ncbi:hypothetical protein SPBRAN_906 [uncultured Candidatus Thioglobus sp.]|nr:hypothetical protein SPBRAN_906 [uncultured Candidatus Thioglobus sp.]
MPIFDQKNKARVFWVGLSAVQFGEGEEKLPLSPLTRSGGLIAEIEKGFEQDLSFYKTNLVKCLPLKLNKIRYPLRHEMDKCFPNFKDELEHLKPRVVFLLGKQVANYVLPSEVKNGLKLSETFDYTAYEAGSIYYIPIHHPSYILVYKRKLMHKYIAGIQSCLSKESSETVQSETISY